MNTQIDKKFVLDFINKPQHEQHKIEAMMNDEQLLFLIERIAEFAHTQVQLLKTLTHKQGEQK